MVLPPLISYYALPRIDCRLSLKGKSWKKHLEENTGELVQRNMHSNLSCCSKYSIIPDSLHLNLAIVGFLTSVDSYPYCLVSTVFLNKFESFVSFHKPKRVNLFMDWSVEIKNESLSSSFLVVPSNLSNS